MFETELFERFSRIHPATVFVVWIPVMLGMVYRSWARDSLSVVPIAALVAAGLFTWTLCEYVLHRWVFHWVDETPRGQRIHFLLHGVHHEYPNDKDRLVMPLGASIPLGAVFFGAFYLLFGMTVTEPLFAGMVLGYLVYDGTHYAVHHFKPSTRVGRFIKRHHMLHHHMDHDGGFGVSSPLWDVVFRTMPSVKKPAARRESTTS
ncbi:MAG TPA: sterol desaturase family protein [Labilithrix sp.]|nr:sterol desaturase family protein [Labilithrix sp.]